MTSRPSEARPPTGPGVVVRWAGVVVGVLLGTALALGLAGGPAAAAMGSADPAVATAAGGAEGAADAATDEVVLELFHGEGCPHCAAERAWLAELAAAHPDLRIDAYEVWNDEANRALLAERAEQLGFEPTGVPVTIVGDRTWIGFSEPIAGEIEAAVVAALAPGPASAPAASDPASPAPPAAPSPAAGAVELPVVGSVDLAHSSLLVSTLLIGFADGINPCSLWVLAVLLAIVLHSGSRGRVALVGSTFLLVTAAMYALYIVGMYSALDYAGQMAWIRAGVAAVALVFGVLQLKDGVTPGVGPSLSISPGQRPRLYRAMRGVAHGERGLLATLAGTVTLAVGVSLLETPCTAGLPLLWTSMLADQQVPTGTAVALFGVYMAVFLLDELVLFAAAVITMRARHLQAEEGRVLKIISGSLLVTLALTMLLAPQALTGLGSSLLVFALAGVLAAVVWAVARAVRQPSAGAGSRPRGGSSRSAPRAR